MNAPHLSYVRVDLDTIAANVRALKALVGPRVEVMAVVKANAYGHGAVPVARAALAAGATRLVVARMEEGVELRQAGITAPILITGYQMTNAAATIVAHGLTPTVNTTAMARALADAARAQGRRATIQIKVDTGLSRYGMLPEDVLPFLAQIRDLATVDLEGVFTHLATADERDKTFAREQLAVYRSVLRAIDEAGYHIRLRHVGNSAGALDLPEAHFDAVRSGIAMYGLWPSAEVTRPLTLRPALSLHSHVARVRQLPVGAGFSYGRTFIAQRPTRAALVPVGYGDGYHRLLSNRGAVLIRGLRAPILGRVCMDYVIVDASDIEGVQPDDEVVLIGRQGEGEISADEVAGWAGTINYEVTTSLLPRLPRVYVPESVSPTSY